MADNRTIQTLTDLLLNGSNIQIHTFYLDPATLPDTILCRVSDEVGSQDYIPYIEGELLIRQKNTLNQISYSLNSKGELILMVNTGDANNYSINSDGNLVYTTEE